MNINILKIKENMKKLKEQLEFERVRYHGYQNWYEMLEFFRKEMMNYVELDELGNINPKMTQLDNGHIIDHHAMGYLAPLDFKRTGFYYDKRSPSEQLILLNDQLRENGVRFIYVALPCKKAIYPEFIVPNIDPKMNVIPQWRKMLLELVDHGVEVVDIFPEFQKRKNNISLYVTKNHHVSPLGADVVAQKIADYLSDTTTDLVCEDWAFTQIKMGIQLGMGALFNRPVVNRDDFYIANTVQIKENNNDNIYIYTAMNEAVLSSKIIMIGDCNLQAFLQHGASIVSNASYYLNYPIHYGGRYLLFDFEIDGIWKMPEHTLKSKEILIYVGFPSASFVRARNETDRWSTQFISSNCFK